MCKKRHVLNTIKRKNNAGFSQEGREHTYLSRNFGRARVFCNIRQESDILKYFHFWRSRLPAFVQVCKRLSPKQRRILKARLQVCRVYSDRYLDPFLSVWYQNAIIWIEDAIPAQHVFVDEKSMEEIIAKIYETHTKPIYEIFPLPKEEKKSQITKEQKSFVTYAFSIIKLFLTRRKASSHQPEWQKLLEKM